MLPVFKVLAQSTQQHRAIMTRYLFHIYTITQFDPRRNFWLDKGLSAQTHASQPAMRKRSEFPPSPFVLCAKMLMAAAKAEEEELNTKSSSSVGA